MADFQIFQISVSKVSKTVTERKMRFFRKRFKKL
jgi:hypothetical protein